MYKYTHKLYLHSRLLKIFGDIHRNHHVFGTAKPAQLWKLEKITVPLVLEVVGIFKDPLKDPEWENKIEAASAEIGELLSNSIVSFLSYIRPNLKLFLLGVCTREAPLMVKAHKP